MREQRFVLASSTEVGDRKENQDRCLVTSRQGTALLVMADGLGGHPRGDAAAQILVEMCQRQFDKINTPVQEIARFLVECIRLSHMAINRFGASCNPPISPRTTAVIAIVQNGLAQWAHVGDSRAYLLRDNRVFLRTEDHSQVQRMRNAGHLSENELSAHPLRNGVTRCVGGADRPPQVTLSAPILLRPGDTILLCSDGMWSQLPQEQIVSTLSEQRFSSAISALASDAEAAGSPRSDNVTVAALRWLQPEDPGRYTADAVNDDELDQAVESLNAFLHRYIDKPKN